MYSPIIDVITTEQEKGQPKGKNTMISLVDDSDTEDEGHRDYNESSEEEENEADDEGVIAKTDLFSEYQKIYQRDADFVDEVIKRINGEDDEDEERDGRDEKKGVREDELVAKAQLEGALTVVEDMDIDKGRNWDCDMVLYNLRNYSTRAIESLVGCKVKDVNFSMGAAGIIMFRITRSYNAMQAIINVAHSGEGTDKNKM